MDMRTLKPGKNVDKPLNFWNLNLDIHLHLVHIHTGVYWSMVLHISIQRLLPIATRTIHRKFVNP